tara:strand:- start:261 stop:2243 length:1983 start_codon:yes stop_codon:yes gene_type:complete
MTTPSNTGWYFMSIPNDQSIRFYVQKTLDASNLDISLICVPLNKDVVRNDNDNEMTDISLSNFISSLNYNDGPVENYGEFTVNDWGKLSIFDYDTKLSLPSGISSIPCWVLLKNKIVPSLVIDTSLVNLKEYYGVNYDIDISNDNTFASRPGKSYVINKLSLNFPESTQIQKISYGGNITPLNGISNEEIVYESLAHHDVNNVPANNFNTYHHYFWFDNYKYPTEIYKNSDLQNLITTDPNYGPDYGLYNIRNKDFAGEMTDDVADSIKYDFAKMNEYSDNDSYLTVGDISYGIVTRPNVLVENVNDNSWNIDLSYHIWETDIWEPTGKTPSLINWTDISLGHKPLRWGPSDRKEHLANKDENLEILQLILDQNSTGTIELSYGNDLDNQIYYQKLFVNSGEISMNLVRNIPPGLVINVTTGEVYLKGHIPRESLAQNEKCYVEVCHFNWFSRGEGFEKGGKKCGTNNSNLTDLNVRNKLIDFNSHFYSDTTQIIQDLGAINNVITNNQLTVNQGAGTEASSSSWVDNITKITRDAAMMGNNGIIMPTAVLYTIKFDGVSNGFDSLGSKESSSDSLCQANEQLRIFNFNPQYISFMKENPPNQVYLSIKYANTESRGNQYYPLSEYEYMFTPDEFPPKDLENNSILHESGFYPLTIIEDL